MSATSDTESVSKRDFAEMLRVSPGRISQLIKSGLPVEDNGRINVGRAKAWINDNTDRNRRRLKLETNEPSEVSSAKAAKDVADAKLATLRAERLESSLIDRLAALRAIEARARAERDAWIGWVNRAAPEIAREVGGDMAIVVATLDRLVREQLAAIAATPIDCLGREDMGSAAEATP